MSSNPNSWIKCDFLAQQLKRQSLTPAEQQQKREELRMLRLQLSSLLGAFGEEALEKAQEITGQVQELEDKLR
jgi:hypothetical protein